MTSETTWNDLANAFRALGASEGAVRSAIEALKTTKLRPEFVYSELERVVASR